MCQYNNIYTSLHKYLKEKKKHKPITIKIKNKKTLGIVPTVPLGTIVTVLLGIIATVQNMGGKKKGSGSRNQMYSAKALYAHSCFHT